MVSSLLNIAIAPFLGIIGDRVPTRVLIPVSFGLRGLSGYLIMLVTTPESFYADFILIFNILSNSLEIISIDLLFFRHLPNSIRGSMLGV